MTTPFVPAILAATLLGCSSTPRENYPTSGAQSQSSWIAARQELEDTLAAVENAKPIVAYVWLRPGADEDTMNRLRLSTWAAMQEIGYLGEFTTMPHDNIIDYRVAGHDVAFQVYGVFLRNADVVVSTTEALLLGQICWVLESAEIPSSISTSGLSFSVLVADAHLQGAARAIKSDSVLGAALAERRIRDELAPGRRVQ